MAVDEIRTPGTVIENALIETAGLAILADHVTLRNCKIVYTGELDATWTAVYIDAANVVIEHCEIDGQNKVARGINGGDFITVRNCNIHDTGNGIEINAHLTATDNYLWNIHTPSGMDWHSDGIQAWEDATDVTIVHNTILLTGDETGAVNMQSPNPTVTQTDILVQHNLMAGGGYTIYVGAEGGNTNVRVIDNHLSTRYHPKVGYYNIWYNDYADIPRTGNVIHETGAPANDNL